MHVIQYLPFFYWGDIYRQWNAQVLNVPILSSDKHIHLHNLKSYTEIIITPESSLMFLPSHSPLSFSFQFCPFLEFHLRRLIEYVLFVLDFFCLGYFLNWFIFLCKSVDCYFLLLNSIPLWNTILLMDTWAVPVLL